MAFAKSFYTTEEGQEGFAWKPRQKREKNVHVAEAVELIVNSPAKSFSGSVKRFKETSRHSKSARRVAVAKERTLGRKENAPRSLPELAAGPPVAVGYRCAGVGLDGGTLRNCCSLLRREKPRRWSAPVRFLSAKFQPMLTWALSVSHSEGGNSSLRPFNAAYPSRSSLNPFFATDSPATSSYLFPAILQCPGMETSRSAIYKEEGNPSSRWTRTTDVPIAQIVERIVDRAAHDLPSTMNELDESPGDRYGPSSQQQLWV